MAGNVNERGRGGDDVCVLIERSGGERGECAWAHTQTSTVWGQRKDKKRKAN